MKLTLCIIAGDECPLLDEALASAGTFADEIVLVHTGNGSRTPEIAQTHGARLLTFPWSNDFALARNASLDGATGEWILVLDSDEVVLNPEAVNRLRPRLEARETDAFLVRIRCPYSGGEEELASPRLFRHTPSLRYAHAVHEQLTLEGHHVEPSDVVILHKGYMDDGLLRRKAQRNDKIIQNLPPGPHKLHFQIRSLYLLGQLREIPPLVEELILQDGGRLHPGRRDIYFCGAMAFLRLGRLDEADALLERADGPEDVDLSFARFTLAALQHVFSLRRHQDPQHPLHRLPCSTMGPAKALRSLFKELPLSYAVERHEPLISLCMIARDEEAGLKRALKSALPLVDEMVVLDTGSHDATMEIARGLGARVYQVAWENDFSKARNACLDLARGRWALILDGHEVLDCSGEDLPALRAVLRAEDGPDGFLVMVESPLGQGERRERFCAPRLFRNDGTLRYQYPVHNQLITEGRALRPSRLRVLHDPCDAALRRRKLERSMSILETMPERHPFRLFQAIRFAFAQGRHDEVTRLLEELRQARGGEITADMAPVAYLAILSYRCLGEAPKGERLLGEALAACPDSVDLRFADFAMAALGHAEAVIKAPPSSPPCRTAAMGDRLQALLGEAGLMVDEIRP